MKDLVWAVDEAYMYKVLCSCAQLDWESILHLPDTQSPSALQELVLYYNHSRSLNLLLYSQSHWGIHWEVEWVLHSWLYKEGIWLKKSASVLRFSYRHIPESVHMHTLPFEIFNVAASLVTEHLVAFIATVFTSLYGRVRLTDDWSTGIVLELFLITVIETVSTSELSYGYVQYTVTVKL